MTAILRDSELLRGRAVGAVFWRENQTENYVCIPPALIITDVSGGTWTIGNEYAQHGWQFYWNVLRNEVDTGELACKIEYHKRQLRILTRQGWKTWTMRPRGHKFNTPGYFV